MAKLRLTIAFDKYDYLQPLLDGDVQAEGIDLNILTVESGIRHERMFHYGEYDACEFSMSSYLVARGQDLQPEDLPESVMAMPGVGPVAQDVLPPTATLAEIERMAILQALQRTNWNKQDAAQLLGLYRPTLYSKMKKHGITSPPRVRRRLGPETSTEPATEPA